MLSLIATIASIVLSMLMFGGFVTFSNVGVTNVITAAAASQLVIVNKAAEQYVKDNGATIAAQATATTPVTITAAMLINATNLQGFSPTNVFGQTWQVQVLQPSAGVLQTVVQSIGGRPISDTRQLVQIAAQAGAQGGFVPFAGQNGDPTMTPTRAYGAYGMWGPLALTGFTNPGAGHLVSLLAFTGTQSNNSYLYRVAVPSHPELSAMQTTLGMTGTDGTKNDITGAGTVTADKFQSSAGGQFNTDQGGSLELGGNNGQAGTGTPYIDFHLGGQGVQDFNTRIVNDSNGKVSIYGANGRGSLAIQGTIQPGNVATPGTACPNNGEGAGNSDGSGQWLHCIFHVWKPIGGPLQRYGYYTAQHGSGVPAPTCPAGGTPMIVVTPNNFSVDPTTVVNYGAWGVGPWTVYIMDGANSPIAGATATVGTYCGY